MTRFQKIIKYLAIAFAFCLIAAIVSGVIGGLTFLTGLSDETDYEGEVKDFSLGDHTKHLKIDLDSTDIIIKEGEKLSVESSKENIVVKEKLGSFSIVEKTNPLKIKEQGEIILTIPKGYVFNEVNIDTGKGELTADVLQAKKVYLDFGAGEVTFEKLISSEKTVIDGGAGKININGGKVNDLRLNMGAGKLSCTAEITGESEFNCGVGNVDINLLGKEENYKIDIDKGLGNAAINGESISDEAVYGSGANEIEIDGGVGDITIKFN